MKCIYCGTELKDGSRFCYQCGKEARMVPDYNVLEDEYLKSLLEEKEARQEEALTTRQLSDLAKKQEEERLLQQKAKEEKKRKQQIILIAASISLAVLLLIAAITAILVKRSIDEKNASSYDYQVQCAEEARQRGEIKEAVAYYEAALILRPHDVSVRLILGQIYMDQKDYNSAQICYREILQEEENNEEAYRNLIAIYENKKDTEAILALFAGVKDDRIADLFSAYVVTPPVFSHAQGTLNEFTNLTLSTSGDYEIFYTMDGKDPIKYGNHYRRALELDEMKEYTIKAVCVNDKGIYSEVVTMKYVVVIPPPDMPVVTPEGGVFDQETKVTIQVPEGYSAYYIWSRKEETPNVTSEKYVEPLDVPKGNNILSVILVDEKTEQVSEVFRGNYVYNDALTDNATGDTETSGSTDDSKVQR